MPNSTLTQLEQACRALDTTTVSGIVELSFKCVQLDGCPPSVDLDFAETLKLCLESDRDFARVTEITRLLLTPRRITPRQRTLAVVTCLPFRISHTSISDICTRLSKDGSCFECSTKHLVKLGPDFFALVINALGARNPHVTLDPFNCAIGVLTMRLRDFDLAGKKSTVELSGNALAAISVLRSRLVDPERPTKGYDLFAWALEATPGSGPQDVQMVTQMQAIQRQAVTETEHKRNTGRTLGAMGCNFRAVLGRIAKRGTGRKSRVSMQKRLLAISADAQSKIEEGETARLVFGIVERELVRIIYA